MKISQQLVTLIALVSTAHIFADGTTSKIVPRSQSFNAARQIVGWDNPIWGINRKPQDDDYASFNLTFEYTRTFRDNRLAQALFGNDLVCTGCDDIGINISGSAVPNRGANDWLADYFGLPRDFQSTVSFNPRIQNYILEFNLYLGLDSFVDGMYFNIYGPFVHTKWNLNAKECISNAGTAYNGSYFQGYFSSNVVPTSNLNTSFLNYANGCTPLINNDHTDAQQTYCEMGEFYFFNFACSPLTDIIWQSLCCSKMSPECCCEGTGLTRNGFGELRFVLGYNFVNDEAGDYHAGLGIYAAAPTGTRVGDQDDCNAKGRYLFEPIVGNGKHWELGAQVTTHSIFWRNEEETKSLGLYIEANISHLFGANQIRCFDLCSAGSNSRYMLAEKISTNSNTLPEAFLSPMFYSNDLEVQFANQYAPVANLTRSNVISKIGAQGDVAFSFTYQAGNFQWDLGYDFWGRSCEDLRLDGRCCEPPFGQWALKGDQRVYGFLSASGTAVIPIQQGPFGIAVQMPVSDSQATIHTGSNMANGVNYTGSNPQAPNNFYADNSTPPTPPQGMRYIPPLAIEGMTTLPEGSVFIYNSNPPIFIQESDFDLTGTRGISNKLFTHFNYAWPDMKESKWTPYVGIGAEVEFGSGDKGCNECENPCSSNCNTTCNPCTPCGYPTPNTLPCTQLRPCCTNVALSQWGIWFKVGTSYN